MDRERKVSRIWAGVLGFLASFGGMGVLITAMRFENVPIVWVAVSCALASAVFALCLGYKGFPAVPALLCMGGFWLWRKGLLEHSVEALLYQITRLYDQGYGCGYLRWSQGPMSDADALLALCLIGTLIALTVSWTVARNRSLWLAVPVSILPLAPCMVLTDTVPRPFFLYLQLLSILLLLLPRMVRRRDVHQGNALLRFAALPAAIALGLLFAFMPRESYSAPDLTGKAEALLEEIAQQQQQILENNQVAPGEEEFPSQRMNLTTVGPKRYWEIPVMDVWSDETGTVYLRGTAYDVYRGTYWDVDTNDSILDMTEGDSAVYRVKITTGNPHNVLYMPYISRYVTVNGEIYLDTVTGRVENPEKLTEYIVAYRQPYSESRLDAISDGDSAAAENGRMSVLDMGDYIVLMDQAGNMVDAFDKSTSGGRFYLNQNQRELEPAPEKYLQLDADTARWAAAVVAPLLSVPEDAVLKDWEIAKAIRDYVSASAKYDLQTDRMPGSENDFARWFLESSETGYCVHFASAAAVLLRAAGIPARYVTGYLVSARENETVTVMQKNAHAWVECYIETIGWVVLEPTPGGGIAQTAGQEATAPSTEPPETTQATETTGAQDTTGATQQTQQLPETSVPGETPVIGDADKPVDVLPRKMPGWLKTVLWSLAAMAAVLGQWRLRVWLRLRRRRLGSHKKRALAMWRDITLFARLQKNKPQPQLLELAQKAKFSQHKLTGMELKQLEDALRAESAAIKQKNVWKRLLASIILALH